METPHYWVRMLAAVPSQRSCGQEGPGSPYHCPPSCNSCAQGKPAFVGKGKQEEKHFTGACCLWSERALARCSGEPAALAGNAGLGHGPGWQQMPTSTLGPSSGLRQVEKPHGLAMDEGVSGYGWEQWVWALQQGLLAGGGNILTMKCSFKNSLQW